MGLSVIIPVFNEEIIIKKTLIEINNILVDSDIEEFEIIAINDGSTDNTEQEISESRIKCNLISHKVNKGYGASLRTGLRNAKYNNIVITDADGTYPNDKIPEMYEYYKRKKLD